jgi:hypothetical protein
LLIHVGLQAGVVGRAKRAEGCQVTRSRAERQPIERDHFERRQRRLNRESDA